MLKTAKGQLIAVSSQTRTKVVKSPKVTNGYVKAQSKKKKSK